MEQKKILNLPRWIRDTFKAGPESMLLLLVVPVLLLLSWLDVIESPATTINLTLAVLIVINMALVRHGLLLRAIRSGVQSASTNLFLDDNPANYHDELSRAHDLWITGTNLRRIFPDNYHVLEQIINKGGTIHAILLREGEALKYAAQQDAGPDANVNNYAASIKSARFHLEKLKLLAPMKVRIYTIDYPLPFGIDAIDIDSIDGVIYLRFYPFFTGKGDHPIVVLRPNDSIWFEFYKNQLKIQRDSYACESDMIRL